MSNIEFIHKSKMGAVTFDEFHHLITFYDVNVADLPIMPNKAITYYELETFCKKYGRNSKKIY